MTDAGWNALAQMVVALCAALAAIFARAAGSKAQEAATVAKETARTLERHEVASQGRGQALKAEIAAVRAEPLCSPGRSTDFIPGGEGTAPPAQQG